MAATRAPVHRLVDLAVAVPACSLVAARRAVPIVARLGTVGTARLVGRVSDAVHQMRADGPIEPVADSEAPGFEPQTEEPATPAVASVSVHDLPIEGYDDLAARHVVDRLAALDRADLARVEAYERRHRNRSTVLGKISILSA